MSLVLRSDTLKEPIKFLGCSTISFNSQIGWGLDSSTITVELVEDCEKGDRFIGRDQEIIGTARYFDTRDPQWVAEEIDTPRWESNFVFGGIVTNWTQTQGTSGHIFSIQMSDAKQLLSNIFIETDTYSWYPIWDKNYFNVLAKYEANVFYGDCQWYGTANSNQRGMNYNNIIQGLLNIAEDDQAWNNIDDQSVFENRKFNQRPVVYSPLHGWFVNGTQVQHTAFVIDFGLVNSRDFSNPNNEYMQSWRGDALPIGPNFYRIAGSITLLDLINNICDLMARNFYVSMYYDAEYDAHVIQIRCVHLIDEYAGNYTAIVENFNGAATDLSYGREFNNNKNRNMIMGENVHFMSQATLFNHYFGDSTLGAPQSPLVNSNFQYLDPLGRISPGDNFWVKIDVTQLNVGLYTPFPSNSVYISEKDLLAATAGKHIWEMRATAIKVDAAGNEIEDNLNAPEGSLNKYLREMHPGLTTLAMDTITRLVDTMNRRKFFGVVDNERFPINDMLLNTFNGYGYQNNDQKLIKDLEAIYNFVSELANKYYGKQFLYQLNENICYNYVDPDTESGALEFSASPTNEGAWVEPGNYILGLRDGYLAPFKTEDGRTGSFVRFDVGGNMGAWGTNLEASNPGVPGYNGILDVSQISPDSYVSDGSTIWIRSSVAEKTYTVYNAALRTSVPAGVIELDSPAFVKPQIDLRGIAEQIITALMLMYQHPNQESYYPTGGTYTQVIVNTPGSGYATGDVARFGDGIGVVTAAGAEGYVSAINITYGGDAATRGAETPVEISSVKGSGFYGVAVASAYNQDKYWGLPTQMNPDPNNTLGYSNVYNNNNLASQDTMWLGAARKAIFPSAAAIPIRSNIAVYGPYYSNNFFTQAGGVNVQQDKDLAPWNFGSATTMYEAGMARANTAFAEDQEPLIVSELGDAKVPGMPLYSLGDQMDFDGVVRGPLVNNINVSFGGQGITTGYGFKTFSRKFGNLPAVLTEQIKLVGQNREKQLQFIRENIIRQSIIGRKSLVGYVGPGTGPSAAISTIGPNQIPRHYNGKGETRVLMGESYDWTPMPEHSGDQWWHPLYPRQASYGQRSVSSLGTYDQFMTETGANYDKKGFMSLDGIFSSVSVSGDGGLPRYPTTTNIPNASRSHPINPNPPSIHRYSGGTEGQTTTSSTRLTIGVGTKTLEISPGLNYLPGKGILITSSADDQNYMIANIGSYNSSNGVLSANITKAYGSGEYTSWTVEPNGNPCYDLDINVLYQNPLTNSNAYDESINGLMHHYGPGEGHSIDIVGMGGSVSESGAMLSMRENEAGKYASDYRFMGLRGPIVLHQWGYDLEGKPVPNRADTEENAKKGIFNAGIPGGAGPQDFFLQDWLQKPATWPAAPIDLRFDRNRGVWVSPPAHKMVVVQAKEIIPAYGTGKGMMINQDSNTKEYYGSPMYDSEGLPVMATESEATNFTEIIIEDRIGRTIGIGEKAYAYFDSYTSTYLVMGGGGSIVIGKFCNQWPSLMNVKDQKNCVKKVVLYTPAEGCSGNVEDCGWKLQPMTTPDENGIERPVVVEAVNLFANVAAHEYQTKWCALSTANGYYYLIAAES